MTITNALLGLTFVAVCVAIYKVSTLKSTDTAEEAKVLREMMENVRRDLADTKDKLKDGMGKNAQNIQERLEKTMELVNKQLGSMDSRIDKRVIDINNRLDAAAKMMGQVQKQYGNVEQISAAIQQLQETFKSPKPRGGFGEKAVVDLVAQVLPVKSYEAQHRFRGGDIVDLLVKTSNGDIPIDAKFPLENYMRIVESPEDEELKKAFRNDVKKHIRDIAKKYILPDEGTLEFALMYVPSDAVMYEILTDAELSDLAESLHVFILSPHSFYYFLNVIRLAYQSQKFEENAKQVLGLIRGIQQQSGKLGEDLAVLQKHMGNAAAKMGEVQTGYGKLDMQIKQAGTLDDPASKRVLESATQAAASKVRERRTAQVSLMGEE
jgi:DNA recombination protein RmuC